MLNLREIGKVELHRHLEGSLRVASLLEIAREHRLPLPAATLEALAAKVQVLQPMGDLMEVLAAFDVFQRSFVTTELVERLTFEAVEDAARENIRLLELRFSPDFMARPHSLDWDALMEALLRGVARARREHDLAVGLIAIASRGYGVESAVKTAAFALRWRHALVGFDLADDEIRFPSRLFVEPLSGVRAAGLPITVHSGEAAGPEFVWQSIELLGASRIGHGVAVAAEARLIEKCIAGKITLEMCPTSNLRTRAVPSMVEHPASRLLRAGVQVTLNSDDPGLFGIDLTHELEVARRELGFSDRELALATRHALEASFLPAGEKAALIRRHFGWIQELLAPA